MFHLIEYNSTYNHSPSTSTGPPWHTFRRSIYSGKQKSWFNAHRATMACPKKSRSNTFSTQAFPHLWSTSSTLTTISTKNFPGLRHRLHPPPQPNQTGKNEHFHHHRRRHPPSHRGRRWSNQKCTQSSNQPRRDRPRSTHPPQRACSGDANLEKRDRTTLMQTTNDFFAVFLLHNKHGYAREREIFWRNP